MTDKADVTGFIRIVKFCGDAGIDFVSWFKVFVELQVATGVKDNIALYVVEPVIEG